MRLAKGLRTHEGAYRTERQGVVVIEVSTALLTISAALILAHSICRAIDANSRWTTIRFVKPDVGREGRVNRILVSVQRAGVYSILLLAAFAAMYLLHIARQR